MTEDVPQSANHGFVVNNGLGRIPTFPKATTPSDESADLLRDVGEKKLHEYREISPAGPNQEMQVVRRDDEAEELHAVGTNCPRQSPSDEFIGLGGWT
jgi:hypothetical protein